MGVDSVACLGVVMEKADILDTFYRKVVVRTCVVGAERACDDAALFTDVFGKDDENLFELAPNGDDAPPVMCRCAPGAPGLVRVYAYKSVDDGRYCDRNYARKNTPLGKPEYVGEGAPRMIVFAEARDKGTGMEEVDLAALKGKLRRLNRLRKKMGKPLPLIQLSTWA